MPATTEGLWTGVLLLVVVAAVALALAWWSRRGPR
jgi:hypothetical protein